jgi:hypothetical protein
MPYWAVKSDKRVPLSHLVISSFCIYTVEIMSFLLGFHL